ncbi:hypothetical protein SAY86_002325 [Trapa natans]|uniref:C3H1-type domain-containing protein n=1 Tax=Trapa natans TaxID=22666 RepID=A0AAN7LFU0_TRANT|nr:hypothetical protein SAY86_002325 [Trapa natans]
MKSQTYASLSRIFALFDEENQPPRLVKFSPCYLSPGLLTFDDLVLPDVWENTKNESNDQGKTEVADPEKEEKEFPAEKCETVDEMFDDGGLSERPPTTPQMTLDEIAVIMSVDEDVNADLSEQKFNIAESNIPVDNLEDNDLDREQMIIDELQAIVCGDPAPSQNYESIEYDVSSGKTLCGDSVVKLEDKQKHSALPKNDMNEFGVVSTILKVEDQNLKDSEMSSFSPGHNVQAIRPSQDTNSPVLGNSMSGAKIALHQKGCVASGDNFFTSVPVVGDDKLEEGELSNGLETELLSPMHSENPPLQNAKIQGVCVSSSSVEMHHDAADGKVEWQQRAAKDISSIPLPLHKDLVFYGDILGGGASDEGLTSEKQEIDVPKERKRGPCSKERKERKKKKEREKRAQKNRELGVKRLKLQPVQKPKTIAICRHFIYGRCQEGEKCKFSHDTVPLTKSKPCLYFARHSCMKGDSCPFDHELSNYPCTNFEMKGFCFRGDTCMFSHKVLPKRDSLGPEAGKASKPHDVSNKKRPERDNAADAVLKSLGISFKSMDNITASSFGKTQIQKSSIASYAVEDIRVATPIKSGHGNSFSEGRDGGSVNNQAKEMSTCVSVKKHDETPGTSLAPKGINFLSFGGSFSGSVNGEHPKLEFTHTDKETTDQRHHNMSEMVSKSSKTLKWAQPSAGSQKPQNVVSANTWMKDTSTIRQATSPSGVSNEKDISAQGEEIIMSENVSVKALPSPTFPETSRQQAEGSKAFNSPHRFISNSVQKVLSSTLAFAQRCEKEVMAKNHPVGDPASCTSTDKEATDPDDKERALKILDFLSSIRKK